MGQIKIRRGSGIFRNLSNLSPYSKMNWDSKMAFSVNFDFLRIPWSSVCTFNYTGGPRRFQDFSYLRPLTWIRKFVQICFCRKNSLFNVTNRQFRQHVPSSPPTSLLYVPYVNKMLPYFRFVNTKFTFSIFFYQILSCRWM